MTIGVSLSSFTINYRLGPIFNEGGDEVLTLT